MPKPLSICLEDLGAVEEGVRYTRCVALPGGQPGLGIDRQGRILWQAGEPVACELWISADDKLILRRRDGAPEAEVRRAGRSTSVPVGKPVVLLDQDEVHVEGHGVRIHVHGEAQAIHPPTPLKERLVRAAGIAAAVALTMTPAAAPADEKVEVRERPPEMVAMPKPDAGNGKPDAGKPAPKPPPPQPKASPEAGTPSPLEIREKPPAPMANPKLEQAPLPPTSTPPKK